MMDRRPTDNVSCTVQSLNTNPLQLDFGGRPVRAERRSLDETVRWNRRVVQCIASNVDSGNESGSVTSHPLRRNKILALISDTV